jgi:hypothetical protein
MASHTRTLRGGGSGPSGSDPLAEAYGHWLIDQVREPNAHLRATYWDLLTIWHETEFVWLIPNDDNRLRDGLDLRHQFLDGHRTRRKIDIESFGPVSMLEVLIALSRRLSFQISAEPELCAHALLRNLGMHKMVDPLSRYKANKAREILNNLIWRTYEPDGTGGFFPLAFPPGDQRKVEIWYQMHAFVIENLDP